MALYKRGEVYWISFTTPNGTRIRRSAKTANKKEAQELLDKLRHESWRQNKLGEKPRHTWDEAALLWLKEKAYKKSIKTDISILRYVTPILRGRFLDEITSADLMRIAEEKKAHTSACSANRCISIIHAILVRAQKVWEWIDKVPAVSRYKEPKRRLRYLTPDEIARLMAELPEYLKPVVAFALLTGLRKGNIQNLKWDYVDMNNNIIIIPGEEMKNGNMHTVPMSEAVKQIIANQSGKNPVYVFTYKGEKIKQAYGKAFKSALKRAGIANYHFHDNRHTWASLLVQNGVSLYELQEMGAWQSANMVRRYAHLSQNKLRANANMLAGVINPFGTKLAQKNSNTILAETFESKLKH